MDNLAPIALFTFNRILFSLANTENFISIKLKITKIAIISLTEIILIIDQFFAQNLSKALKLY